VDTSFTVAVGFLPLTVPFAYVLRAATVLFTVPTRKKRVGHWLTAYRTTSS